jgi:hypothetical protein
MVTLVRRDFAPKKRTPKPGTVPPGRIAIYDHQLHRRGHVGPKASAATAERFGVHNAALQRVRGAPAWVGSAPGKPKVSAVPLSKSLKADRGSVGSAKR